MAPSAARVIDVIDASSSSSHSGSAVRVSLTTPCGVTCAIVSSSTVVAHSVPSGPVAMSSSIGVAALWDADDRDLARGVHAQAAGAGRS